MEQMLVTISTKMMKEELTLVLVLVLESEIRIHHIIQALLSKTLRETK